MTGKGKATKDKTGVISETDFRKYDAPTKELARYSNILSALLWRKALANSSPEVREILLVYAQIENICGDVIPSERRPIIDWENAEIREHTFKAEELLTGNF